MAMTTVRIGHGRSGTRRVRRADVRNGFAGTVGFIALAGVFGMVAPVSIGAAVGVLIGGGGESLAELNVLFARES